MSIESLPLPVDVPALFRKHGLTPCKHVNYDGTSSRPRCCVLTAEWIDVAGIVEVGCASLDAGDKHTEFRAKRREALGINGSTEQGIMNGWDLAPYQVPPEDHDYAKGYTYGSRCRLACIDQGLKPRD